MAPTDDVSVAGSKVIGKSGTKGRGVPPSGPGTPSKSSTSGNFGRGTPSTKFGKSGRNMVIQKEQVEKPQELRDAISARAPVLSNDAKAWEIVGASASLSHSFGANASMKDPIVSYAGPPSVNSDHDFSDRLLYSVGGQVVSHDVDDGIKGFLKGKPNNVVGIIHVSVNPTMQLLSVCEDTCGPNVDDGEIELKSQLSIYSLVSKDKECLATLIHNNNNQFQTSVFTKSPKQIAALTGGNYPEIVLWNWDTKKIIKICSLTSSFDRIKCAPCSTSLMLTTSGESGLKAWYSTSGNSNINSNNDSSHLDSMNLLSTAKDGINSYIIDHCWMPSGNGLNKMCALSDVLEPNESKRTTNFRRQILYVLEGRDQISGGKHGHGDQKKVTSGTGKSSSTVMSSSNGAPIHLEIRQSIVLKLKDSDDNDSRRYSAMSSSQKGFVLCGNYGHVSFYERTDDKREPYIIVRQLLLGEEFSFVGICMLPTEHSVVVITENSRMISMPVEMNVEASTGTGTGTGITTSSNKSSSNIIINGSGANDNASVTEAERLIGYGAADVTHGGNHTGAIICSCISVQRSIIATLCADDNTIRIWNYETNKCEVVHYFGSDEAFAVDIHNNGLFMVVSFKDRVRGYNIGISSLIPHNEVITKNCKEIKFSYGGDYFACASGVNLIIFRTSTFEQVINFQGHMMPIKKISWARGDLVIFSASVDGCVFGWPISRDGRLDIVPSNPRASGIISLEIDSSNLSFLPPVEDVGDDGVSAIRQEEDRYIILGTNNGKMNMPAWSFTTPTWEHVKNPNHIIEGEESSAITFLKLSNNRRHLYAGTKSGTIRIYAWPPVHDNAIGLYSEISAHKGSVTNVYESPRGDKLISTGEDGAIFIFSLIKAPWTKVSIQDMGKVTESEPAVSAASAALLDDDIDLEEPFKYNDQILILAKEDMDEHIEEVTNLHKKLKDLDASCTYKIAKLENSARDNERKMAESFDSTIADERERYEQLRIEFDEKVKSLLLTIETKETDSLKVVSDLENRYEHKLSDQLDRYDKLAEEMELLRQKCEGLLLADRNDFTKQLNDTINNARLREKKMRSENKRITDDRSSDEAAFKEILDQQEHEYEDELRQLIGAAEGELIIERENISKLRTLVQTKNTKLDQLKKKLIELSMSSKARASLLNNEKLEKKKLLETIEHYKKNLIEREEVVAEKEKIIIELRSKTRTLENFRFVLDHRLQQLSAERGPISSHIEGLERHISTMYEELVEEFENKKKTEILKEKTDQRNALVIEDLKNLRVSLRKSERYNNSFKRELGNIVSAMVIGKELEDSVRLLYRKYVKGEVIGETTVKASAEALHTAKSLIKKKDDDFRGLGGATNGGGGNNGKDGSGSPERNKAFNLEVEETLIESAKEAERQKISKGKEALQLKHRLESTKQEALVVTRKRLGENSNLLFEVNDLRKDVKKSERKIFEKDELIKQLNHTIREMKRKGGFAAAGISASSTSGPGVNVSLAVNDHVGFASNNEIGQSLAQSMLSYSRAETPNINDTFGAPNLSGMPPRQALSTVHAGGSEEDIMSGLVLGELSQNQINESKLQGEVHPGSVEKLASVSQPRVDFSTKQNQQQQQQNQIIKSHSESVLKRIASTAGIDPRGNSSKDNKWIIHNAMTMNKAKSDANIGGSNDRDNEITSIHGEAWQPQPKVVNAKANANVNVNVININPNKSSQAQSQLPGTKSLSLKPMGMNSNHGSGGGGGTNKKLTGAEATKDRQITLLKDEKDYLVQQLDETTRHSENQRVEIAQLRKQLMRVNGLGFDGTNPNILHSRAIGGGPNGGPMNGGMIGMSSSQMEMDGYPHNVVTSGHGGYTDENGIQMSDEFQGGSQFVGDGMMWNNSIEQGGQEGQQGSLVLNNTSNEPLRVHSGLTHADITGQPSEQDLQDMRLGSVGNNPSYPNQKRGGSSQSNQGPFGSRSQSQSSKAMESSSNSKTISLPQIPAAQQSMATSHGDEEVD